MLYLVCCCCYTRDYKQESCLRIVVEIEKNVRLWGFFVDLVLGDELMKAASKADDFTQSSQLTSMY